MRRKLLMSAAGLLVAIAPVMGHHAFGGEFDPNKPVLLKGKVTKLEWVNPHAWIHVEIAKADGEKACEFTPSAKCDEWMVEGGTPNTLLRRGITRDSLKAGTELVIDGPGARPFAEPRERPQRDLSRWQEAVPGLVGHRRADRRLRSDRSAQGARARRDLDAYNCRWQIVDCRFTED